MLKSWLFKEISLSRSLFYGVALGVVLLPSSIAIRFMALDSGFFETHYIRQNQTALTVRYMARNETGFFNYHSPLNGKLWNFTREMPIYQWIAAQVVRLGVSLETATRSTTLFFFFCSIPFLFLFFREISTAQTAYWSLLFVLGLPFLTIYSRTCLVDITSLCLSIIGFYFAVRFWKAPKFSSYLSASLLLTLSGLAKSTVWFGGVAAICLLLLTRFPKQRKDRNFHLACLSLLFQSLCVFFWTRWANSTFSSASGSDTQWIIGTLSQRLDWQNYKTLFLTLFVQVLNYWAFIPFVLGCLLWPYGRLSALIVFSAILVPLLTFFNVSIYHDYYFIGLIVPIVFVCSVGMTSLFEQPIKRQYFPAAFLVFSLVISFRSIGPFFETILSQRNQEALEGDVVATLTDSSDLIFSDLYFPRMSLAIRSDRLFLLNRYTSLDVLQPTFFYFDMEKSISWLSHLNYPRIFIDSTIFNKYGYRLKPKGNRPFDRKEHIAIENTLNLNSDFILATNKVVKINPCLSKKGFVVGEVRVPSEELVEIYFHKTRSTFLSPVGKQLSLPGKSPWGCSLTISSRKPSSIDASSTFVYPVPFKVSQK